MDFYSHLLLVVGVLMIHSNVHVGCEQIPSSVACQRDPLLSTNARGMQREDAYCNTNSGFKPSQVPKQSCLRVAVVEYSRVDDLDCKKMIQANLDAYEEIVRLAKKNGAKMVLFPEDGLLMNTAKGMFPCVEEIPDPEDITEGYNPCLQPTRFGQHFNILTRLSCLAKEHQIYLVANYGTKEKKANDTSRAVDSSPTGSKQIDGDYFMLNTDVIFDSTGQFVRRYRKWNPFTLTEVFHKAPRLEHVYLDTEYGRFGIFTCFDMLFKEPAVELVEQFHVDTVLFPTWWFDELPLLTAVQIQDGWSTRHKVNLLASNILRPLLGSMGSGIYSADNSVYVAPEHYSSSKQERKTKVILGTIQTRLSGEACEKDFEPKIIEFDANASHDRYLNHHYKLNANDTSIVLGEKSEDTKTVCSGQVCCTIYYKLSAKNGEKSHKDRLIFFARDAPRPGFLQWYEQVCALATLKNSHEAYDGKSFKDLEFDSESTARFEKLTIKGTFGTNYVYPIAARSLSKLVERDQRKFECDTADRDLSVLHQESLIECSLEYLGGKERDGPKSIYSFGLYGRVYERDVKV